MTLRRKLTPLVSVGLALAAFVAWTLLFHHGGSGEESFVGRISTSAVQAHASHDYVKFTNQDGEWWFSRRCQGTDISGVGYIVRYVSRGGWLATSDILQGGYGDLNDPAHGGIGAFGLELARGAGADRVWENTQHMSLRRCGINGVTSWTGAQYGVGKNAGYYDQDVWLGTADVPKLLRVRYRWRIDPSDVRLYGAVDVEAGSTPRGAASSTPADGAYYAKEPKLDVVLNGQATPTPYAHFSTFDSAGRWLSEDTSSHDRECSYGGTNVRQGTGHCFAASRERVRWDYEPSPSGGCSATRPCFNAVLRALPASAVNGYSLLEHKPVAWESVGAAAVRPRPANLTLPPPGTRPPGQADPSGNLPQGFDAWAQDASREPSAGPASDGCNTIEGQNVVSPAQENARNWEFGGTRDASGDGYANTIAIFKAWDGCKGLYDATSLFRQLQPNRSYGWFMSLSLGAGWRRQ